MVEFKVVVSDPKTGKSYQKEVAKTKANSLIGRKIGDEIDGIFVDMPGYKLKIMGGTDRDGFPMRKNLPGTQRKKLLLSGGIGFKPKAKGERRKKNVRGNTISEFSMQINMKIINYGPKPVEEVLQEGET